MLRRGAALLPAGLRALCRPQTQAPALQRGFADLNVQDRDVLKKFIGLEDALGVPPDARAALTALLNQLLTGLSALPEASDYRRAVEATTSYRLKVLGANDSDAAVEEVLDAHMEELILETREELALLPLLQSWKPWQVAEDHQVPVVDYTSADAILNAPPPPK